MAKERGDCEICQTSPAEVTAVRKSNVTGDDESLEMCFGCLEGMESDGFTAET